MGYAAPAIHLRRKDARGAACAPMRPYPEYRLTRRIDDVDCVNCQRTIYYKQTMARRRVRSH